MMIARFLSVRSVLRVMLASVASVVALLSGCSGGDAASMVIGGNKDQSLAITRERTFLWNDWTVYLVVSNYPDCARRYPLKPVSSSSSFKVEVYRDAIDGYVLRQGKRWYVASVPKCQSQQFKEAPPEPGELLGRFIERDGMLMFKAMDKNAPANGAASGAANGE